MGTTRVRECAHNPAAFADSQKCSKAASRADLNPESEFLIDTKAYNEVKVIIRMVYGALARFKSCAYGSIG